MAGDKTLIAYVTKGGVTEEGASVIVNVLRDKYGFEMDVVNLRKTLRPDIACEAFGRRMKILGRVTADNRDMEKVHKWADELVKKFRD